METTGAWAAAREFVPGRKILAVVDYGQGNVNDTFLVTLETGLRFILQRLNSIVFPEPGRIMHNLGVLSGYVFRKLSAMPLPDGRRWETPRVLLTREGQDHWLAPDRSFWRALSFIGAARTLETIQDHRQAWEVGYALGTFHSLLSDLPPEQLVETLPGFHHTPSYLERYDTVLAANPAPVAPEVAYAQKFIQARRDWAPVLERARRDGALALRTIHGDPKVNNVLLDPVDGRAVGLIDLDTVQPGLVHHDIGDCLRSAANPWGEETDDWQAVRFDANAGRALLQGYLEPARAFLTAGDYEYLYDGLRLIAFELGLRFFTDYLAGNVYFKARHPRHNLERALVQFKLTESIEAQETNLRRLIQELR